MDAELLNILERGLRIVEKHRGGESWSEHSFSDNLEDKLEAYFRRRFNVYGGVAEKESE